MLKKVIALVLVSILLCQNTAFCTENIRTMIDRQDDYRFKTVSKKFTVYSINMINGGKDTVYFSSKSEAKFKNANDEIKSLADDESFYKKVRKREVGRYFWIDLPCAVVGGFIIGASFFLLLLPGAGIFIAGNVPFINAVKYNSKLAQDFYIDYSMPLNLEPGKIKTVYVFVPKKETAKSIIFTNLMKNNKKTFDIEVPVI